MFNNIEIEFSYSKQGKEKKEVFKGSYSNEDFDMTLEINSDKNVNKLKLVIFPRSELIINKLSIKLPYVFKDNHRIFVNGYQSWTDSREFFINERLRGISKLAKPLIKKYHFDRYGDYNFRKYTGKKGEFHGYTYSYIREGLTLELLGSLSERSGYTVIEQYTKKNIIIIDKDCRGLAIDRSYTPFELFYAKGSEERVFDGYFEAMGISKPRFKPSTGWTSWYNYYQNIDENIIIENLNNFEEHYRNIDIFQIDDGYQSAVGDWLSTDSAKFPRGMKYICDSIKTKGYKAGIWLAPFACEKNSKLFQEKKHWLLKDEKGEPVMAGSNWSGFYALDIYNNEVREYIRNVFSVILKDWGYDMVKLDFLYAACLLPRRDKTRGQIMTEAMEFLRECVGDKIILGCGVPLGPSFGIIDYCRIGCDVGLDWNDKFYMRLLHRERISTLNAIENTIGRRQLNGRAFLNDPDVFLLRKDNIALNEAQKETVAMVNNLFGSLLFTSDNIKYYDDEQFSVLKETLNFKASTIESVERSKKGMIEVLYREEGKRFLTVFNLSGFSINYSNSLLEGTQKISPYETKRFPV